jgi:hypothetical protein
MTPRFAPQFDPENPAHRTVPEWQRSGTGLWYTNMIAHVWQHRVEARVLLPSGQVIRAYRDATGRTVVEVL